MINVQYVLIIKQMLELIVDISFIPYVLKCGIIKSVKNQDRQLALFVLEL